MVDRWKADKTGKGSEDPEGEEGQGSEGLECPKGLDSEGLGSEDPDGAKGLDLGS